MYEIKARNTSIAWKNIMTLINNSGTNVVSDQGLTREILNLCVEIQYPMEGYPIEGTGWDLPALEKYARDLTNFSYDLKGFDYNYCERMGRQVYHVTELLKNYPNTRQATIYLWIPEKDLETKLYKPCQVVADYKLRDGKLHATHFFRSHDARDAYPQNIYGLGKLQKSISDEIGCIPGTLSTISASAHYYIR